MANQYLVFITSCATGGDSAITTFSLDTGSGTLTQLNRCTDIGSPFFIALSNNRKFLYSTHTPDEFESGSGYVVAFEIRGTSGELHRLNEQRTNGLTTCYVDVDPSGKAIVFANYSSGSVGSYPVKSDGSLGTMASFAQHHGASMVDAERQEAPHAHCAKISPNGEHMYACDLGLDQIIGYTLDAKSALLTPLTQPYVRTLAGGGPRHFTYHPQGKYVYANNELANSVNVYNYNETTGMLVESQVISTLPDNFDGDSYTADVKITPDGRYLYCTNRGHDSIAIFRISGDGALELVEIQSSLGNFPQNLAVTPDGNLLLCANMNGNNTGCDGENVVVFRIDRTSGKLSVVNEPMKLVQPSCIMIA